MTLDIELGRRRSGVERIEVFEGHDRSWAWRLVADNNCTVAVSARAFKNRSQAVYAAERAVYVMRRAVS